jgi:hypothetical protein
MNLSTDLYHIDPDWFRGTVDDIWELRHQVSSFCDPLELEIPFVFTALQALGQLGTVATLLAERIPTLDETTLAAFEGLAASDYAKGNAARLFDCAAPSPREEQSIHCASVEETQAVIAASRILSARFDEAAVGALLSQWTADEPVRALFEAMAGLEADEKCLIGWTYSSFL